MTLQLSEIAMLDTAVATHGTIAASEVRVDDIFEMLVGIAILTGGQ